MVQILPEDGKPRHLQPKVQIPRPDRLHHPELGGSIGPFASAQARRKVREDAFDGGPEQPAHADRYLYFPSPALPAASLRESQVG
jgi:hypothetical protein